MSDLNAHLSTASFWIPEYLPQSAWIEQAPLAFWLVESLRPRRMVELGTGRGFSYFAFCQAVQRLGLGTETFAVDRWDDEAIYHDVAAHNARYANFSTLVRASFDTARSEFSPGAVDLLHLDGEPASGAFGHDLDAWRPLLADDAVVLIHGTATRDSGFRTLFDALGADHPSLLVPHGQGLGIVAAGGRVPDGLRPLFAASGEAVAAVMAAYAALGEALRVRQQLAAARDGVTAVIHDDAGGHDREAVNDIDPQLARLQARMSAMADRSSRGFDELNRQLSLRDRHDDRVRVLEQRLAAIERRSSIPAERALSTPSAPWTAGDDGRAKGAEVDRLQAKLRDARSSEAAAHRFARAARRAIKARHAELGRQALELEQAAASARAEVFRLAADAEALLADEHAAEQGRDDAQSRLNAILRQEREALAPRGGVRDALALGGARRWRRKARTYEALVGRVERESSEIQAAQQRYAGARERRRQAEQLALAAEPRASELETAAVMLRGEFAAVEEILSALPAYPGDEAPLWTDDYGRWVELYDTITDSDRRAIRARLLRLDYRPLISIVMPVYNTPLPFLRKAVASVQAQLYPDWELCLADDASPDPAVFEALRAFAEADRRIRLVKRDGNGHISAASNSALALATGTFVALLDHDDVLAEQALFEVVACLNETPDLDLIYSDEDHIDQYGTRSTPYFKPDYNHELMLGHNLINHLGVYRRELVERVGGFRLGYEGSQDYDLALRVIDASHPGRIRHIPSILYHWRSNTGEATFSEAAMQRCILAARRALTDHLARRGEAGEVVAHPIVPVWQRIRRARPDPAPLVSVIVPTKDKAEILEPCVRGVLDRTHYPNLEVVVVDHQSAEPATLRLLADLARDGRVRILPHVGAFNYSAINNAAVAQARGSVLALLNNDVDVIDPDWLDEMVSLAVLPGVGAVGAKLLYPDNRVQHGGVVLGPGGVAGHMSHLLDAHDPSYFGRGVLTSAVSAVTAACLVVRKSVFDEVGGFDGANLPVAFNDVDLCLKIREAGYRNVWTPHAQLYHHESISRGSDDVPERVERFNREIEFMQQKWDGVLDRDPAYNPNLNIAAADFSLAFPPRRKRAWRVLAPDPSDVA